MRGVVGGRSEHALGADASASAPEPCTDAPADASPGTAPSGFRQVPGEPGPTAVDRPEAGPTGAGPARTEQGDAAEGRDAAGPEPARDVKAPATTDAPEQAPAAGQSDSVPAVAGGGSPPVPAGGGFRRVPSRPEGAGERPPSGSGPPVTAMWWAAAEPTAVAADAVVAHQAGLSPGVGETAGARAVRATAPGAGVSGAGMSSAAASGWSAPHGRAPGPSGVRAAVGGIVRRVPERRRWAVGPLVALVVVTGVCTAAAPKSGEPGRWGGFASTSTGLARSTPAQVQRLKDVRKLLDGRADALLRRDRQGWLAGVDPAARTLRSRQAALFANIAAVPLAGWRYEIEPENERGREERTAGRWTAEVTLHYGMKAVDPVPTSRPLLLTFTQRQGRWMLAADDAVGADGTRSWRGPWEYGPLVVRRGRSSLVLAHPANAHRLAAFTAGVDAAVPRVRRVIGGKRAGPVAVLIPDDQREMTTLVGERLALGKIAAVAVADSVDPTSGQARGQRVVVNPANLDRLGTLGRRVVLQHEVTHVATRGVTGPGTPIWLVEGLADWVGYLDSGLPARLVGDELRGQLRSGRWPGRLPEAADFRGDSARLSVAYEEAWSACRLIADRAGPGALVRLYRAVGTADDPVAAVDVQLRRTLGLSYAQFVAEWRRSVRADFG